MSRKVGTDFWSTQFDALDLNLTEKKSIEIFLERP